jgi:hypothetical protein
MKNEEIGEFEVRLFFKNIGRVSLKLTRTKKWVYSRNKPLILLLYQRHSKKESREGREEGAELPSDLYPGSTGPHTQTASLSIKNSKELD